MGGKNNFMFKSRFEELKLIDYFEFSFFKNILSDSKLAGFSRISRTESVSWRGGEGRRIGF